jgi:DNA-directed RNA polymerase specialized sigma24 family protein
MGNTALISEDDLQFTVFLEERNQRSLDYFYDKYSPALYGAIYGIISDRHLAEECLTTTFVKAWNEIEAFRGARSSLFTWLLHIARQSAFEVVTRERERNPAAYNSVNGRDLHYSAFELVYHKGLNIIQAAELSGITIIELKNNLRRDLQNMKNKKVKT